MAQTTPNFSFNYGNNNYTKPDWLSSYGGSGNDYIKSLAKLTQGINADDNYFAMDSDTLPTGGDKFDLGFNFSPMQESVGKYFENTPWMAKDIGGGKMSGSILGDLAGIGNVGVGLLGAYGSLKGLGIAKDNLAEMKRSNQMKENLARLATENAAQTAAARRLANSGVRQDRLNELSRAEALSQMSKYGLA